MRVQMPRLEVIQDLSEMVANAVNNFGEMNKAAPDRIILFRDGISEGEFDTVSRQEISAIRGKKPVLSLLFCPDKALLDGIKLVWKSQGLNPNNMPKLTYIIVGKRSVSQLTRIQDLIINTDTMSLSFPSPEGKLSLIGNGGFPKSVAGIKRR